MREKLIYVFFFILLFNCKTTQNTQEKLLVGNWSQNMRSDDTKRWEFSKKGTVIIYFNDNVSGQFYYSVLDKCPEECQKYKSKWDIDHYLYLVSDNGVSRNECYEIIFEDNGDISIRDLPLERDTYEILKKVN